jgi:hypothetical protein
MFVSFCGDCPALRVLGGDGCRGGGEHGRRLARQPRQTGEPSCIKGQSHWMDICLSSSLVDLLQFLSPIGCREKYRSTANEGPVRIQYKYLVPCYVFPEMKLCSLVISKTEF